MLLLASTLSISFYTKTTESNITNSVIFSNDGTLVAVGTTGIAHNIYTFSTMTVAAVYNTTVAVNSVIFSPDSQYIAYALASSAVQILYVKNFSVLYTITSPQFNSMNQVDFNNDSTRLIVCGKQGNAKLGYEIWNIPP